jgi:hypothetical protein
MIDQENSVAAIEVLRDLVDADKTFESASSALASAVDAAIENGIKSVDLEGKPKGKWYNEMKSLIAASRLNEDDLALWQDPTVKQKAKPKNPLPEHAQAYRKQAVDMKVVSVMRRIRDKLSAREAELVQAVLSDGKPDDKASTGGKPNAKTPAGFVDLCMKDLQASYTRAMKDRVGDEPAAIDHAAFMAHIQAAADVLGKTLKDK